MAKLYDKSTAIGPPTSDEVEISLFGPGYGECVLIHVGDNQWIIVDSCIASGTEKPVALDYLEKIGVDPGSAVQRVIATHWHDDHVRGLARVIKACSSAKLVISGALKVDEFFCVVQAYSTCAIYEGLSSGVDEMARGLNALRGRESGSAKPMWATANRRLWQAEGLDCELWSLSPSDAAFVKTVMALGQAMPKKGKQVTRLRSPARNPSAVVLWVQTGSVCILLGSDLEESAEQDDGWTCIVSTPEKPDGKAMVFKVPHHGSSNGHCDAVWDEMLTPRALALITPFQKGRILLPQESDCERLVSRTSNVWATAQVSPTEQRVKRREIDKTAASATRWRRKVRQHRLGHVCVRIPQECGCAEIDADGLVTGGYRLVGDTFQ